MTIKKMVVVLVCGLFCGVSLVAPAQGRNRCRGDAAPLISFIEFQSPDIAQTPPGILNVKGKLKLPADCKNGKIYRRAAKRHPAVVILHGSSGVDFRGDFYARALNAAGIATLEIDMWEARGVSGVGDRPALPILTYPDAFSALRFLSEHPRIDPDRIGVLGFSWGGVVTMASATNANVTDFGGGLRFAAHAAQYPVCYAYNSSIPGSAFADLTGAPILIQIGEEDEYDNGSAPCFALKESLELEEQAAVEVVAYENAFHAWDRLEVPITVNDPFSNLGSGGDVGLVPNVEQAHASRNNIVDFFCQNLNKSRCKTKQ